MVLASNGLLIIAAMVIGGLIGLAFSLAQQPTYQSTAVMYQAPIQGDSDSTSKQRTQGIVALLTSDKLVSSALSGSGLRMTVKEAQEATTPTANVGSSIVNIVTTTHDPDISARLANALAATLPKVLQDVDGYPLLANPSGPTGWVQQFPPTAPPPAGDVPPGGPTDQPVQQPATPPAGANYSAALRLSVISPAVAQPDPVAPKSGRNIVLGAIAGLLLAVFVSYLSARFTRKVQDTFELSDVLGTPVLGTVPARRISTGPCIVDFSRQGGAAAEAFRRIRTAVADSDILAGPARRIVVTSPSLLDGVTTTAVNLGRALALDGSSVVLVDAVLRTRTSEPGDGESRSADDATRDLAGYLNGGGDIMACVAPTRHAGLSVVRAGDGVADPTEMLGSQRLRAGLDELATHFDYVIIDSPPLERRSDAVVLARAAETVLLVVRSQQTRYVDLGVGLETLDRAAIPVLGVVLNGYPGVRWWNATSRPSSGQPLSQLVETEEATAHETFE